MFEPQFSGQYNAAAQLATALAGELQFTEASHVQEQARLHQTREGGQFQGGGGGGEDQLQLCAQNSVQQFQAHSCVHGWSGRHWPPLSEDSTEQRCVWRWKKKRTVSVLL